MRGSRACACACIIAGTYTSVTVPRVVPVNSDGATPTTVYAVAVEADCFPHHRRIRGETPAPQTVADDDDGMRAGCLIFFRQKKRPSAGCTPSTAEVIAGDDLTDHAFGVSAVAQAEGPLKVGDQSRQHVFWSRRLAYSGYEKILGSPLGIADERDELIRPLDRQRPNQHLVQQREDRGVRADAQRQREHSDGREAGMRSSIRAP